MGNPNWMGLLVRFDALRNVSVFKVPGFGGTLSIPIEKEAIERGAWVTRKALRFRRYAARYIRGGR